MRDWLISRLRHNDKIYLNGINSNKFDDKVFLTWVNDRNYWYAYVINYFNNKNNLLVIDICDDKIVNKLNNFLCIKNNDEILFKKSNTKLNFKSDLCDIENEQIIDKFLNEYIDCNDHISNGIVRFKKQLCVN